MVAWCIALLVTGAARKKSSSVFRVPSCKRNQPQKHRVGEKDAEFVRLTVPDAETREQCARALGGAMRLGRWTRKAGGAVGGLRKSF